MKKLLISISVSIALCAAILCGVIILINNNDDGPALISVSVKTAPKTEYYVGESVSLKGGLLEVKLSDGNKWDVNMDSSMYAADAVDITTPDIYVITLSYTYNDVTKNAPLEITYKEKKNVYGAGLSFVLRQIEDKICAGDILEANPSPGDVTVTYQWEQSDAPDGSWSAIPGANGKEFYVDRTLIQKYVRAKIVAGEDCIGFGYSNSTDMIEEIVERAETPVAVSATDTIITLAPVSGVEYAICWFDKIGGTNPVTVYDVNLVWQTSNEFTGLNPYYRYRFVSRIIPTVPYQHYGFTSAPSEIIRTLKSELISAQIINLTSQDASHSAGDTLSISTGPVDVDNGFTVEWQFCDTSDGEYLTYSYGLYLDISEDFLGKYVRVIVTGTWALYGTVTSAAVELV